MLFGVSGSSLSRKLVADTICVVLIPEKNPVVWSMAIASPLILRCFGGARDVGDLAFFWAPNLAEALELPRLW